MKKLHEVSSLRFEEHFLCFVVDNREYRIDLHKHSPKLANADEPARQHFIISPAGYGIHWPALDEDLSIDGMIRFAQQENTASAV
ncbi:MAG: DUF2442 domain-containing protein [bacterium]